MYSFLPLSSSPSASSRAILSALRLAAGQRRRRLAEPQVAESDLLQLPERLAELLLVREEADRLVDRELEHVGRCSCRVLHVEHFGLEPLAAAVVAWDEHVGHEHHLDLEVARALARLAASAGDVEAERARACSRRCRASRQRRRRCAGSRRTPSRTSRDSSAAICRSGSGRSSTTSSSASKPVSDVVRADRSPRCCLARVLAGELRLERAHAARRARACSCRMPDTPVTAVTAPSGMRMSTPLRLCSRAPVSVSHRGPTPAALAGTGISRAPVRYCPVSGLSRDARHRAGEHELAALLAAAAVRARPCSRRRGSRRGRARRRAPCCRRRAAGAAAGAAGPCRASAGRSTARRARRACRRAASRASWRARCAAPRRRRACACARLQREVVEPDVAEEAGRGRAPP